ncbi:MAG TPA: glutaredoxin family protein [Deltaproteobacteria bacterium]|jgi:glutaredoxin|nr:glutaredoxin family protein [Deltaproteobacteria bacterium]HOI06301.1 glutaredoxin family protein [Deltaproteobacteria bacterium]
MGPKIMIYTLSTCSHCKACKSFLNDHKVEYDYVDVDQLQGEQRQDVIDEMRDYNPNLSFPTILIGDKVIIGFRENELKEVLGI